MGGGGGCWLLSPPPQEKLKTMLMQNFGGDKQRVLWYVMVFSVKFVKTPLSRNYQKSLAHKKTKPNFEK